jgi:hypothetical protein
MSHLSFVSLFFYTKIFPIREILLKDLKRISAATVDNQKVSSRRQQGIKRIEN